ncbi:MAG: Uncharacterised protein [Alphaproteobacteria bacterium]|nr:MAG: Uncharacterised protein [Alphaproteobacteria bacterium]
MHRREFTAAGLALIASAVCKAHASDNEILLGQLDLEVGHNEVLVQTGASQSALRLGKCAFLFAPFSSVKFNVGEGLAVKAANLMMGAMHSVFDPNGPADRTVITTHATIGIRGTAHYVELEANDDRTYSCCCYGHIHIQTELDTETQKTNYHDARIIDASGKIQASPYNVPLNHYDNSIVFLENSVGRKPRWSLPNGEMQFIAPFALSEQ